MSGRFYGLDTLASYDAHYSKHLAAKASSRSCQFEMSLPGGTNL